MDCLIHTEKFLVERDRNYIWPLDSNLKIEMGTACTLHLKKFYFRSLIFGGQGNNTLIQKFCRKFRKISYFFYNEFGD